MKTAINFIIVALLAIFALACSKDSVDKFEPIVTVIPGHELAEPEDPDVTYYTANIVPQPASMIQSSTSIFKLANIASLTLGDGFSDTEFELLRDYFDRRLHVTLTKSASNPVISYEKDATLAKEEYKMEVTKTNITITSATDIGRIWGVQSLRHLIDCAAFYQKDNPNYSFPVLSISDKPKYEWRSLHHDVCRHFFSQEYLMKVIDWLSYLKIAQYQLHLNDDQGWRIVVDSYPDLAIKGSIRDYDSYDRSCINSAKTNPDMALDPRWDIPSQSKYGTNAQYRAYFTKDEMREIIDYATKRGVDIVPEIDMPGHLSSAQVGYPYLSCTGTTGWGSEFTYPMCVGNPLSRDFYRTVYAEMADFFPSSYFHIGADEAEKTNWKTCSKCQQFLADHGQPATNVQWLQDYFVKEVTEILTAKGKKVIAWDDAFIPDSGQDITYMFWRSWRYEKPMEIINQNSPMIWADWDMWYLSGGSGCFRSIYDLYLPTSVGEDGRTYYGAVDPSKINGYAACIWTETIPSENRHQWHLHSAIFSASEKGWGTDNRPWAAFTAALAPQVHRMDTDGIKHRN